MGKKRTDAERKAMWAKYEERQKHTEELTKKSNIRFAEQHSEKTIDPRFPLRNREAVPKKSFLVKPYDAREAKALRLAKIYNAKASDYKNKFTIAQMQGWDYETRYYTDEPEYKKLHGEMDKIEYDDPERDSKRAVIEQKLNTLRREVEHRNFIEKQARTKARKQAPIYWRGYINNSSKIDDIIGVEESRNIPYEEYVDKDVRVKGFDKKQTPSYIDSVKNKNYDDYFKVLEPIREKYSKTQDEIYAKASKERNELNIDDDQYSKKSDAIQVRTKKSIKVLTEKYDLDSKKVEKKYHIDEYTKEYDAKKAKEKSEVVVDNE